MQLSYPSGGRPSHGHTLGVRLTANLAGACARPGTQAPVTKPLLHRLPHWTLRPDWPLGVPLCRRGAEAEQQHATGAHGSGPLSLGTETLFWKRGTLEPS